MRRLVGWIMLGLVACLGCGGKSPAVPTPDPDGAARVLAVARDLDNRREAKRALEAYHQVVRYYPGTPEAKEAAARIAKAEREATQKVSTRKRK